MPPLVRIPAALRRSLIVTATATAALLVFAGSSSAAVVGPQTGGTAGGAALSNSAGHGATLIGVSVGTLAWASVGLLLLIVGLFAASRSGHRGPAAPVAGSLQVVPGRGGSAVSPSSHDSAPELSTEALAVS